MPRGGKRLGAGRKPKTRTERWLGGDAAKRGLSLVRPDAEPVPVTTNPAVAEDVPSMLTEAEAKYWELWAPSALERGTLTEHTRPGLVLLCQVARRAAALWAQIESQGLMFEKVTVDSSGQEHHEPKAHPLLTHYRGLVQRAEQLMARYGLASDGKIPTGETAKKDTEREQLAKLLAVR